MYKLICKGLKRGYWGCIYNETIYTNNYFFKFWCKTMLMDNVLPSRYAQALFSIALEHDALEVVESDFLRLKQIVSDESKTLFNIVLPYNLLSNLWLKVADGCKLHELTINFIMLLAKNKRLGIFKQVVVTFRELMLKHKSIKSVYIIAAVAIDVKEIKKSIEEVLGTKIIINQDIKPELLGGFKMMIDSKMLDCSLRSKLDRLKNQMQQIRIN